MKNRVKDGYADGKECINQLFDINYRFKKILIFFLLQYFFFKLRPPINKISWICLLNLAYWGYCYEKRFIDYQLFTTIINTYKRAY